MTEASELAMFPAIGAAAAGAEVDDLRNRSAEVEVRLDFAERLLAHGRQVDQLPGGVPQ